MLGIITHQGNENKNYSEIPTRRARIKNSEGQMLAGYREVRSLLEGTSKGFTAQKISGSSFKQLNTACDQATLLLGLHSWENENIYPHKNLSMNVYVYGTITYNS